MGVTGAVVAGGALLVSAMQSSSAQAHADLASGNAAQALKTQDDNLVTQAQDQQAQQTSSAAAVATRNAARQSQLTAAANYTGFSGTVLGSPLGAPTGSGSTSKTILGS